MTIAFIRSLVLLLDHFLFGPSKDRPKGKM